MSVSNEPIENDRQQYICIHCGHPVSELYKKYSPSVLKIMNCVSLFSWHSAKNRSLNDHSFFCWLQKNCGEIADKYIEFEPMIVAIDLILLSRPAYKHLLFNTKFRVNSMCIVTVLLIFTTNSLLIVYRRTIGSCWWSSFYWKPIFYISPRPSRTPKTMLISHWKSYSTCV